MRLTNGRIIGSLFVAGGWLIAGVRAVLDIIGYATIPEDTQVASGLLRQFLLWVLSLPWWVPWGFALIAAIALIVVSWPRGSAGRSETPEKESPEPKYASPFAGKTPAPPETIPQRFIEVIDRDDNEIASRIRLHAIPKPIQIHRCLETPDPYLNITVFLWNNSVYELEFVSLNGGFS
ncbi:MAG: hypothetical protein ACE5H8_14695 [Alphaproteobacteria bacterium]